MVNVLDDMIKTPEINDAANEGINIQIHETTEDKANRLEQNRCRKAKIVVITILAIVSLIVYISVGVLVDKSM